MKVKENETKVTLVEANAEDAVQIYEMQKEAFRELLDTYQDFDTNPGNETIEKILFRMEQEFTHYYFICLGNSPIFILPSFQGKGLAQEAIRQCEEIHGKENWALDTILQEEKNCYLYEKMGYVKTGKTEVVNDKLTLVFYEK